MRHHSFFTFKWLYASFPFVAGISFGMEAEVTPPSSDIPKSHTVSMMRTPADKEQNIKIIAEDQHLKEALLRYQSECPHHVGLVEKISQVEKTKGKEKQSKILHILPSNFFSKIEESIKEDMMKLEKRIKKNGYAKANLFNKGISYLTIKPKEEETQPRLPSSFMATLRTKLPKGQYTLELSEDSNIVKEDLLAWALSGYNNQFSKAEWKHKNLLPTLAVPKKFGFCLSEIVKLADVTTDFRTLIRTRTNQFTPNVGASFMHDLAARYGADVQTTKGLDLLKDFGAVFEVGKGSKDIPNVTQLFWSHANPKITVVLVGKGVCFDTGGNNLKSDPNLMYMDKGGALSQIALAEMIMFMNLPIKLYLANAWVVNSPGGTATNTNDIYKIGNKTVENKNTDAEGRLIMSAVLAYYAKHHKADYTVTQATLTGAATVGYGATAVIYASNKVGPKLMKSMDKVADPAWRGPRDKRHLKDLMNSDADLGNMGAGSGGSSAADQFLCQFVGKTEYIHVDNACGIRYSTGITPEVTNGDMFGNRGLYDFFTKVSQ